MNKELEIQILDQLKKSIKQQRIQRGFLLLEAQRIADLCGDKKVISASLCNTVIERLQILGNLQSKIDEDIAKYYPDWNYQNNLDQLMELVGDRKDNLTKRDRYARTIEDIKNIQFESYDCDFNFKKDTAKILDLNLNELSDEECESILGKYVKLFEALRETSASKQAEWVVILSPLFDMHLVSNVFTKKFTLNKNAETSDETGLTGIEEMSVEDLPKEADQQNETVKDTDAVNTKIAPKELPVSDQIHDEQTVVANEIDSLSDTPEIDSKGNQSDTQNEPIDSDRDKPLVVNWEDNGSAMTNALFKALGLTNTSEQESSSNEMKSNNKEEKKEEKEEKKEEVETADESPTETVQIEQPVKISEHARNLSDKLSGIKFAAGVAPTVLRIEVSKKVTVPFTSKSFKADMSGESFNLKKAILNMAFDFGAVTWQLLTYKENYNPRAVLPEAESLWRKGYLAKKEFEGMGRFYALSDKGKSILGSKETARVLGKDKANLDSISASEYDARAVKGLCLSAALQFIADNNEYFDIDELSTAGSSYLVMKSRKMEEFETDQYQILNIGMFGEPDSLELAKEIDSRIKEEGAALELIRIIGPDSILCQSIADIIRNEYGRIAEFEIINVIEYHAKAAENKTTEDSTQTILFNNEIEERKRREQLKAEEEKARRLLEEEKRQEITQKITQEMPVEGTTLTSAPAVEVEVVDTVEESDTSEDSDLIHENESDDDDIEIPAPETFEFKNPESLGKFEALTAEEADQVKENYINMLASDLSYCAMAYIRAAAKRSDLFTEDCQKLAYAVNDPADNCQYDSEQVFHIYLGKEESELDQYLYISAATRTLFTSDNSYDYSLKQLLDNIRTNEIVSSSNSLSNFLYELYRFKNEYHCGIDKYADYRVTENLYREERIKELQKRASSLYDAYVIEQRGGTANQRRYEYTKRYIFAKDGTISELLKTVINNNTDLLDTVCEYMEELLITDDAEIKKENISGAKIENLIEEGWNDAAKYMAIARKSSRLMGSLRQNLYQRINEVATVISEWVYLSKEWSQTSDEGNNAYSKLRPQLLSDIDEFITESQKRMEEDPLITKDSYAGWIVLRDTLEEMQSRIEGRYRETEHKYFYIRFLKNNKVLLNQDYLPEFDIEVPEIKELSMLKRIEAHAQENEKSLRAQLNNWCEDNFGTARSIMSYLWEVNKEKVDSEAYLEEALQYAAKETANKRLEFIENLELSQSYGQIDSTSEDRKDRILKIIDDWYAWSVSTSNYGFFKCILNGFQQKIKADAKGREAEIRSELDITLKRGRTLDLDSEMMKSYIRRIRGAIEAQNYTYAEDMILRLGAGDTEVGLDLLEEDYLKLFWREFDQTYIATAGASKSLEYKYERFQRENRDTRAARSLISLWLSNGGHMGEERIQKLLYMLGFAIEKATEKERIADKIENYEVTLKKNQNGKKANYKHPIAAFGSEAMQDGFRVVCLYGTYDADRLIEMYREIGDAMNTIVLLDCSLNRDQRQRLARKIKKEASNAVFGLIDRVAFMFLVNNYKDATISKMLMSVMMPFSFYQPYIYDSSSVIPPEMFIGRKTELNKIEDPNGANIVYGGRQLGKSALLHMAKEEIDRNENGDRAVLIDVKGLNEQKSCLKVSQALVDEGILEAGSETEEWSELSRMIRKRLSQEENRIPYLLLLIDEADAFVESSEKTDYSPFDNLLEIQNVGQKRFKFVIAGLRNVVRFNRDNAISSNRSMTKFGALAIRPLAYAEARELLEVPLNCLGLRFPKEKEALVSMIFASANYFPGLIQLYCAKLIEAMTKDDYAGYDQDRTPPYEVMEKHIKKVLADTGFQQQIREKFMITLKIDADDYYYVIALLMAYLYNNFNKDEGYTPEDIHEIAVEYGFGKIAKLDVEKVKALMEEMCELNVFHQLTENHFKFSRYNFYQMMGDKSKVEEEILSYLEGK